jgi:hypothetical protein
MTHASNIDTATSAVEKMQEEIDLEYSDSILPRASHHEAKNRIDGFDVHCTILGSGANGTVHLVRDRETRQLCALKVISKAFLLELLNRDGPVTMDRVKREIAIHSRTPPHPNVLRCYSSFDDERNVYLVLEYAPDGDIFDLRSKMPEKKFQEHIAAGKPKN